MYQTTQAMQMNSSYMQQERLRDAAAERLARVAQSAGHAEQHSSHDFAHRMVAVAVALVTVLGVVALF